MSSTSSDSFPHISPESSGLPDTTNWQNGRELDAVLDVPTEQGTVRGWRGSIARHWTAVPYANDLTTSEDFFSPPSAPGPYSNDFLEASRHRLGSRHTLSIAAPLDAGSLAPVTEADASSTNSNSSTSSTSSTSDAPLPVVVFIHGGRYEMGEADSLWFRGRNFARDNCVYVSLNYRLRFEGFLPLADEPAAPAQTVAGVKTSTHVSEGSGLQQPNEFPPTQFQPTQFRGVEDIFFALHWIHRNIAGFGGDPHNVTLMGQSAGGALTHCVLSDPRSEGLAHRGVCLSMALPRQGWPDRVQTARRVLGGSLTLEHLSTLNRAELKRAYDRFAARYFSDCAVGPYPWDPKQLRAVPMIMGSMRDEFVRFPFATKWDEKLSSRNPFTKFVARSVILGAAKALGMGSSVASKPTMAGLIRQLRSYYRQERTQRPYRPLGHLIGDSTVRRFVVAALEAQGPMAPTWAYEFHSGDGPVPAGAHHKDADAQHCGDLPLVFDDVESAPDFVRDFCGANAAERLRPLATRFHQVVVDFAHGRNPDWPQYDPSDGRLTKLFDMNDGTEAVASDPWREVRRFFPS